MGATVISDSYGTTESSGSAAYRPYYEHPGIPIVVAAGNSGYLNYLSKEPGAPSTPASFPGVVAAGGTKLLPAANARKWTETVDPASGGGCSLLLTKPSWQTDAGCSKRMGNDVAAVGNVETPVSIYMTFPLIGGGWDLASGTSVAAPLVAGMLAQATTYTKSLGPKAFYSASLSRFDITSGSNYSKACSPTYLCAAVVGYDGPSGAGSPNGIPHVTPGAAGAWGVAGAQKPASAGTKAFLTNVSCTSADACTGSGSFFSTSSIWGAMGDGWDGAAWLSESVVPNPGPKDGYLRGISCTSSSSCMAVGEYGNSSGVKTPLGESKTGSSWSISPTVQPVGSGPTELYGVSCTSTTACTAVGHYWNGSKWGAMGEIWNGSTWSLASIVPNRGDKNGFLRGISCVSATWCMAVGAYGSGGTGITLAEERNGSAWTLRQPPIPANSNVNTLHGVSCTSTTNCVAVGGYQAFIFEEGEEFPTGHLVNVPLAERWNGTKWTLEAFAPPSTNVSRELLAVSCPSSTSCYAVGYESTSKMASIIRYWNGSTWSNQSIDLPPGVGANWLSGISCTGAQSCSAVGGYVDSFGKEVPLTIQLSSL